VPNSIEPDPFDVSYHAYFVYFAFSVSRIAKR